MSTYNVYIYIYIHIIYTYYMSLFAIYIYIYIYTYAYYISLLVLAASARPIYRALASSDCPLPPLPTGVYEQTNIVETKTHGTIEMKQTQYQGLESSFRLRSAWPRLA